MQKKILLAISALFVSVFLIAPTANAQSIKSVVSEDFSDKSGWPMEFSNENYSGGFIVANLDSDTDSEVFYINVDVDRETSPYTYTYTGYAIDADGAIVSGWPVTLPEDFNGTYGSVTAADIDGDNEDEIVFFGSNDNIYVLEGDGSDKTSFPMASEGFIHDPMLADIDNDGYLDIIASTTEGIYAYDNTGTALSGFPVDSYQADYMSAADIDGDGNTDLVLIDQSADKVVVLEGDGSDKTGWPLTIENISAGVITGDFDNDSKDEIFCVSQQSGDSHSAAYGDAYFYLLDENATSLSGWPLAAEDMITGTSNFSAGDIDGNGYLDIISANNEGIYAWDYTASTLTNWPLEIEDNENYVTLSDINGDGAQEVFFITSGVVFAYDGSTAEPIATYTLPVAPASIINGADFFVTDLEDDGFAEVLIYTRHRYNDEYHYALEMYEASTGVAYINSHWTQKGSTSARTYHAENTVVEADEVEADDTPVSDASGNTSEGEGKFSVYNNNNEELYSCSVFSSGGILAQMEEFDNKYYVFANNKAAGKYLKVVNPINCEVVDSIKLSKKAKLNKYKIANVYKKAGRKEIVTATPMGATKVKTTVYLFKNNQLKKQSSKTITVKKNWKMSVKKKNILYKKNGKIVGKLNFTTKKKLKTIKEAN